MSSSEIDKFFRNYEFLDVLIMVLDHRYNFISRTTIWYVEVTSIRPMMNESVLSQIKLAQQLCVDLFRFKEFIIIPFYTAYSKFS